MHQRADGRWVGQLTLGFDRGKQVRRTVTAATRTEARRKLAELRNAEHTLVAPERRGQSFGDFADEWLASKRSRVAPRTAEIYEHELGRYVRPHIGMVPLASVEPRHIERMQASVNAEHGARAAVKARLLTHQVLRFAVRMRVLQSNAAEAVDPVRVPASVVTPVEPGTITAFLGELRGHRHYAAFYLAVVTGLRRGELLGLRWADLDAGGITVRRVVKIVGGKHVVGEPKTRRGSRRVPLPPDALALLAEHRARQAEERSAAKVWHDEGWMFPNTIGKAENPHNLLRVMKRARDARGLPAFRLHDLRHLYASMMIRRGVDPKLLSDRLGHARASFTLDVYTHLFEAQRDALVLGLDELVSGVGSSAVAASGDADSPGGVGPNEAEPV